VHAEVDSESAEEVRLAGGRVGVVVMRLLMSVRLLRETEQVGRSAPEWRSDAGTGR
jgi:hypothetical protein